MPDWWPRCIGQGSVFASFTVWINTGLLRTLVTATRPRYSFIDQLCRHIARVSHLAIAVDCDPFLALQEANSNLSRHSTTSGLWQHVSPVGEYATCFAKRRAVAYHAANAGIIDSPCEPDRTRCYRSQSLALIQFTHIADVDGGRLKFRPDDTPLHAIGIYAVGMSIPDESGSLGVPVAARVQAMPGHAIVAIPAIQLNS